MLPPAVIFDFDGVIVDSLGVHIAAWDRALLTLLSRPLSDEQRHFIRGRSTRAIGEYLTTSSGIAPEALIARKKEELINARNQVELLPGVKKMFDALRSKKIPFGIASNAPGFFVRDTIATLGLKVDVALGIEDVVNPKPFPDLFLRCAKLLKASPADHGSVFVFEDSTHGIQAAVSAGMVPVGVMTQHSAEILRDAGAKYVCENVGEVLGQTWFF